MTTKNYASIRPRRGLKADMPSELPDGELVFCTDTQELYVGRGVGLGLKPYKAFEQDIAQAGRLRIVKTIAERDELRAVENGVVCYVDAENVYYRFRDGEWDVFNSGSGGGGTSIGTLTSSLDQKTVSVALNQPLEIDIFFSTPNVGAGVLYIMSDGEELVNQSVAMGSSKISVKLKKGSHNLEVYVIDRAGVYTNKVLITANCGGLDLSTTFDSKIDYSVGSTITFPYTIDTISEEPITTYFKIGNDHSYEVTSENGYNTFVFPTLGAGTYNVEVYSKSGQFESNRLTFTLVMLNSGSLYVSSLFNKKEAEEGDQLIIDYRVSMKNVREFNVIYYVDNIEHRRGKALNGSNAFPISTLPKGERKITIEVSTTDGKHTAKVDIYVTIVESSYKMQEPVKQGLIAWFDAYGLTNQDLDREKWKTKNESEIVGKLHNFNYNTNGWINNGLKMNGSAYAELDLTPFSNNAESGLTIDVEFETEDVGNENARVLDCTTRTSSEVGCYIDTNEALIHSDSHTIKSPFAQGEKTRVTYVIDRTAKLLKLYVNAVLSEVAFLKDSGEGNDRELEDFEHGEHIYLNSQKGTTKFGDCTIYSVRVYSRPLSSKEVLQNHIADIKDKTAQKKKYDFNYKDTIPTMYFEGDVKPMSKENAVDLKIKYISTDDKKYGQSFTLDKCSVKWQGTSSLQYEIKNYKIKLYENPDGTEGEDAKPKKYKHSLREGMIPESTFVLKADYMESSHANNTGLAKIVNRYLYDNDKPLPPQVDNDKVVSAIDGFPIKLYINKELIGVFNFNLDKGNEDSFGFDKTNEKCISYEISANTDKTAGAFNKWDGKVTEECPDELAYLKKDFELRFPDEKGKEDYGYLNELKRVVDWVSDASNETFKKDFEKYFNKEYTLKYYLFVLTFAMVDNLGKNMMLNTWDGNIWYPCFYDLDTCLSLDNSGYIKFDVDVEVESGKFNTSSSKLWTKVWNCFEEELKKMYVKMRSSTFKEENIFKVLIEEQIDQIPELLYNLDSEQKYIRFGTKYIHMLHGSRREHMRKWITERLLYMDSMMGYEEHTSQSITIRSNKEGAVKLAIKTYSPMYIKVKWRNGEGGVVSKKIERGKATEFTYSIPTATDQEIIIYGAKHLKEIGDISHMKPSSLSLGNATKLIKLECRDSPKLQALGLDGNMKYLQSIDVTNCTTLGTASGSGDFNVAKCDNLKILKIHGTSLQSLTFNARGGNLEELYLSNSITSLNLANQYSLKKVVFPTFSDSRMNHRSCYDNGSRITNLSINNCPNLTFFGADTSNLDYTILTNYRGVVINSQPEDFDISKAEYKQAYQFGILGRLENVTINNSLLNHKYLAINTSPSLKSVTFNNMPKLQGLILTGNKTYGATEGNNNYNLDKTPNFNSLNVNECPKFDTLILQKLSIWQSFGYAYKFNNNFTLDLSHLKLKRFICNLALQNVKKIILPSSIKEFSHSETKLSGSGWSASDGSSCAYATTDSPLETIIIAGQPIDDNFKGIDLANIPLKNVSLKGITQKVDIIKNVNCEALDLIPVMVSPHYTGQKFESISINLNNYKETSLVGLFKGMDMTNVRVILENPLATENMNYEHMFYQTKNITWENMQWIKKLPKGRIYQTFYACEVDRLEVGNMIGTKTTDLVQCFSYMPNITYLDVTGADTSAVTNARHAFSSNKKLKQLVGLETLDFSQIKDAFEFLCANTVLTNVPIQLLSKFTSVKELNRFFLNTPLCGTDNPIKIPDSVTRICDLLGEQYDKPIIDTLTFEFGEASKINYIFCLGHMYYPVKHITFVNMPPVDTCNYLLQGNGGNNTTIQSITGINASKMTGKCYPLTYQYNLGFFTYTSFKTLTFEGEISCSELYIANLHSLEAECLAQIIRQLKDKSTETRGVLNVGTENMKKLTQDMIQMAQSKNWSVIV